MCIYYLCSNMVFSLFTCLRASSQSLLTHSKQRSGPLILDCVFGKIVFPIIFLWLYKLIDRAHDQEKPEHGTHGEP